LKYILIILAVLLSITCTKTNVENPDWLLGKWQGVNNSGGRQTFEIWEKSGNELYMGTGYTLQCQDTVFKEDLRLIKINGIWNYEVSGVHEQPVLFTFTSHNNYSFICENHENNFPKVIQYTLANDTLRAIISDEKSEIPFIFTKSLKAGK
jgi:hypothetical protein